MTALLRSAILLALIFCGSLCARAESYPSRQVELIVAYPAGGAADLIARSVAQRLSQLWNIPVVVENRGGGATQVAANAVHHRLDEAQHSVGRDGCIGRVSTA